MGQRLTSWKAADGGGSDNTAKGTLSHQYALVTKDAKEGLR